VVVTDAISLSNLYLPVTTQRNRTLPAPVTGRVWRVPRPDAGYSPENRPPNRIEGAAEVRTYGPDGRLRATSPTGSVVDVVI